MPRGFFSAIRRMRVGANPVCRARLAPSQALPAHGRDLLQHEGDAGNAIRPAMQLERPEQAHRLHRCKRQGRRGQGIEPVCGIESGAAGVAVGNAHEEFFRKHPWVLRMESCKGMPAGAGVSSALGHGFTILPRTARLRSVARTGLCILNFRNKYFLFFITCACYPALYPVFPTAQ